MPQRCSSPGPSGQAAATPLQLLAPDMAAPSRPCCPDARMASARRQAAAHKPGAAAAAQRRQSKGLLHSAVGRKCQGQGGLPTASGGASGSSVYRHASSSSPPNLAGLRQGGRSAAARGLGNGCARRGAWARQRATKTSERAQDAGLPRPATTPPLTAAAGRPGLARGCQRGPGCLLWAGLRVGERARGRAG